MKTKGNTWRIEIGDCRLIMKGLPANSVHSVIVDPPYGISFMEKEFDKLGTPQQQQEFHRQWAAEAYRVLKPGGHILCFGGARTYHRMAAGIEDAGFEIRDQIMWIYGSGFPKSANPSRMIDKDAGVDQKVVGTSSRSASRGMKFGFKNEYQIKEPVTEEAKRWKGWGSNLKPAHEPICVARKPFKGALHRNMVEHGTGALNIDGSRIGTEQRTYKGSGAAKVRYEAEGRAGLTDGRGKDTEYTVSGRWPANVIHDGSEEAIKGFPETADSGKAGIHGRTGEKACMAGIPLEKQRTFKRWAEYGDVGTAARYFYCAKPSGAERGSFNNHPTVKPQALMSYLIKLVTVKGGTVLDPFCGSGTTGVAATRAGYQFIGIEKDESYVEIACKRIGAPMQASFLL